MKIIPDILHPESAQAAARSSAIYDGQWKKALEDAQWQARQRIAADTGENRRPAGDASAWLASASESATPDQSAAQPDDAFGCAMRQDAAERSDALGRALIGRTSLDSQPGAPSRQLPAGGIITAVASSMTPARAAPAAGGVEAWSGITEQAAQSVSAQQFQLYGLPEWPAVVVHASLDANRISLVIRDRNMTAAEASALAQRLRAQLRAGGLELAHLILNGQHMTGDDAAGFLTQVSQ